MQSFPLKYGDMKRLVTASSMFEIKRRFSIFSSVVVFVCQIAVHVSLLGFVFEKERELHWGRIIKL